MVKKRRGTQRWERWKNGLLFKTAVGLLVLLVVGGVSFILLIKDLPSPERFAEREVKQSTKLYDRTGKVLLYEIHGEEKRTVVDFDKIPPYLKQAVLAAEDANFYHEPAFDLKAIVRALLVNLQEGRVTQGGSTITQQLVKNVFLTSERTIARKVKEIFLAVRLESRYSKDEIFSFYLNQIPFGSNAYGVEAASETYFGKHVGELSLAEDAVLASMLKAPTFYSPWGANLAELKNREGYVLDRMVELGYITRDGGEEAKGEELVFSPPSLGSIRAPHFSLAVKEYLVNRYGENLVENGGLNVVTTLDWNLQELAERAVVEGTARNAESYGSRNAALVAQDPKSGQILALVGSKDYFGAPEPEGCTTTVDCQFEGNFNVATQGLRQPGSALKPFVYLTAFQRGYSPKTTVFDVSTEFDTRDDPATSYRPVDFDGKVRGPVHLEDALAQSLNIPAVKTLYLAGFDDVLKNLHAFGITTLQERWRYGLSLTLGGGEVKLADLVNAYATLSQEGVFHKQTMVLKAQDGEGNMIEEYQDRAEKVMDPQNPRLVTRILSDPELRYPIFRSSNTLTVFPDHEVALKTGTSEDHRDAWTVGYTPSLVVGVWAGNNDNSQMIRQGSSILAAVPVWNEFFKEALRSFPSESFSPPDPVAASRKPMLNGVYEFTPNVNGKLYPQLHSVLLYVNKSDPLGPPPENPESDPQFKNWEGGVLAWARENVPNFSGYNFPLPEGTTLEVGGEGSGLGNVGGATAPDGISVLKLKPENGSFTNSPVLVQAEVKADGGAPLKRIELYYNRRLINSFDVSGFSYFYRYTLDTPIEQQNLIQVRAYGSGGQVGSAETLFFRSSPPTP